MPEGVTETLCDCGKNLANCDRWWFQNPCPSRKLRVEARFVGIEVG